jgi:hypothetical protein
MTHPKRHPRTLDAGHGSVAVLGGFARRVGRGVAGVLALLVLAGTVLTGAALALSDGRLYEMVSPVYKGGFGAMHIYAVAPDGESVVYYSPGVFAGAPMGVEGSETLTYIARRGTSGWATESLVPPGTLMPDTPNQDMSSTLGAVVAEGYFGPESEIASQESTEMAFLSHAIGSPDTPAAWEVAGRVLETLKKTPLVLPYEGASADLCHLFFENVISTEGLLSGAGKGAHLYELDSGCGGESVALRLVALNNSGKLLSPACSDDVGISGTYAASPKNSEFNAISAGGRVVFFTTGVEECSVQTHQLFVRIGGARTLEVSRPMQPACAEVPCGGATVAAARASADFVGAASDGSKVFFTTSAPLVEGDKDEGEDLYMARIGCPSGEGEACAAEAGNAKVTALVQVSHDAHVGEAAEVQGVVRVAPDGSRVYFVARGVLGEGAGAEGGSPVAGADNLYVYDSASGRVAFIADLCSGPGSSGSAEDARCPGDLSAGAAGRNDSELWLSQGEAQTAGADGAFLVFSSYGQLSADDTDTASDVYRYDAGTGALIRVSIGEEGFDANGNDDSFDASVANGRWGGSVIAQNEMGTRAISEDGSPIVFTTAEPLSPKASNGLANVYEWREVPGRGEGAVSLLSGGSGDQPVNDAAMSPSGRDVIFVTTQGLLPQDTDGAPDIYDARLGDGFPAAPAPRQPCSGDACQGPLTNPAALLVPGSAVQAAGENLPAPPAKAVPATAKKKQKKRSMRKTAAKRARRKGRKARRAARGMVASNGRGR